MRNEKLNGTAILINDDNSNTAAIIKFYNDNGWFDTDQNLFAIANENCIGVFNESLGSWWNSAGDSLKIIQLPEKYLSL